MLLFFFHIVLQLGFSGAAHAGPSSDLKSLLLQHVSFANQEQKKGYLDSWDAKCPAYLKQAALFDQSTQAFDLSYSLEQFSLIESTSKKAKAVIVLCTQKKQGPAFRDNRMWQLLEFNHTPDGWKICQGKILQIQYFDGLKHLGSTMQPSCQSSIK